MAVHADDSGDIGALGEGLHKVGTQAAGGAGDDDHGRSRSSRDVDDCGIERRRGPAGRVGVHELFSIGLAGGYVASINHLWAPRKGNTTGISQSGPTLVRISRLRNQPVFIFLCRQLTRRYLKQKPLIP